MALSSLLGRGMGGTATQTMGAATRSLRNSGGADAFGKAALRKEADGRLFTFRFLKVIRIDSNAVPGGLPVYHTLEPSSDFAVILHPQGGVYRWHPVRPVP